MDNRGVLRLAIFILFWVMAHPPSLVVAALTLESSFNLTQAYTDNLFYNDNNKEDDFGTFLGPNLELKYANPDIVIGGLYFGRFVTYVNNPDQNRYIQNANIILDLPFLTKQYKNLTVKIDEAMTFTPQLDAFSLSGAQDVFTTPSVQGGAGASQISGASEGVGGTQGVYTSRASSFLNRAGITLGYTWSPRLTPTLAYNNQYRHFFSSKFQDSMIHTGSFSLPYEVRNATIGALYSYRQTEFIGTSTENTSADQIISHNIQLQISSNITPSLTGSIRGGMAFTKQKRAEEFEGGGSTTDLSNKWQTNPIGGATLTKTYQNGSISLDASSTIGSGGGLASQATQTQIITGSIHHNLSLKMNVFASIGYAQNRSIGDGNALDVKTYRIQHGFGYRFFSWLSGNLIYSHIDQRSHGSAAGDVHVNEIFFGLSAIADPWVLIR
ncbi:MAG: hypothetical protein KC588_07645 [Nitrospira sp.]|nr:hypothetical protein [Nitrospira sp.]